MKLSEAIRLGAKLRPQCKSSFFSFESTPKGVSCKGSCALGAAYEGYYGTRGDGSPETISDSLSKRFPVLHRVVDEQLVPDCIKREHGLHLVNNVIASLNDYKGWTREQIADWVEGIENGTA